MWESIVNALKDTSYQWGKLTPAKKLGAGSLFVLIAACLLAFGAWVGEKSYTPLYSDLQPEASIELVKFLQGERIPYLVGNDGKTISIPPEFVKQTLMKLAMQGMPAGQSPGLELFDKESFGTSSYVQRINYIRALQGELTRTINTIKAVKKTSVHISVPPKTSFLENSESPKASVVIELHPGSDIVAAEVKGVQNLVAYAVEGLRPNRVTVVDNSGRSLSSSDGPLAELSATIAERQKSVEKSLEQSVEIILSKIYGQGNVVARVTAELDFDPVKEEETLFDPEQSAVRSQNKQENNMESKRPKEGPSPAGVAAAVPAAGDAAPDQTETRQKILKTSDRAEYEVSRKLRQSEKALGGIKRLSVAVLVKSPTTKDEEGRVIAQEINEDQKEQIKQLIKGSVGFVEGRDFLSVESSQFATEDLDEADQVVRDQEQRQLLYSLIRYGTIALIVFLFFGFVVRPFVRWLTGLSATKIEKILPKTVEELEEIEDVNTNALPGLANLPLLEEKVDVEKAESELLKEKLISLVEMTPDKAGQIITEWVAQADLEAQQRKGRRK